MQQVDEWTHMGVWMVRRVFVPLENPMGRYFGNLSALHLIVAEEVLCSASVVSNDVELILEGIEINSLAGVRQHAITCREYHARPCDLRGPHILSRRTSARAGSHHNWRLQPDPRRPRTSPTPE